MPLVGPAINLAAFTGMPVTVPLRAPLAIVVALAVTAAGLILLARPRYGPGPAGPQPRRGQALRVGG